MNWWHWNQNIKDGVVIGIILLFIGLIFSKKFVNIVLIFLTILYKSFIKFLKWIWNKGKRVVKKIKMMYFYTFKCPKYYDTFINEHLIRFKFPIRIIKKRDKFIIRFNELHVATPRVNYSSRIEVSDYIENYHISFSERYDSKVNNISYNRSIKEIVYDCINFKPNNKKILSIIVEKVEWMDVDTNNNSINIIEDMYERSTDELGSIISSYHLSNKKHNILRLRTNIHNIQNDLPLI